MIGSALAALALGCSLLFSLPALSQPYNTSGLAPSPDLIENYRDLLSSDSGNLTLHYLLGVALLKDQQNVEALHHLQIAYPAYQQSIEAHFNLAVASLRQDDLSGAEIYLEQALVLGAADMPEIFPVDNIYFNMALRAQEQASDNEAIRYFQKVLMLTPERSEVYRQLGDLHARRGDTSLAIQNFRQYLEHFPSDQVSSDYLFALLFNQAQDQLAEHDLSIAEQSFNAALELQPESPTVLYYLGYIAYQQQQLNQATTLLQRSLSGADAELAVAITPILYNTALSLRKAGKTTKALQAIEPAAQMDNATFKALYLAGTLNIDLGDHRAASPFLQRAVNINPDHQGARKNLLIAETRAFDEWLMLAKVKLRGGDLDAAEQAIEKARLLRPQNSSLKPVAKALVEAQQQQALALFTSARTALDAGNLSTALDRAASGLKILPEDRVGLQLRDDIKQAMSVNLQQLQNQAEKALNEGQWQMARSGFQRILTVSPQHAAAREGLAQVDAGLNIEVLALLQQGQTAMDAGQIETAINHFGRILELQPGHEQARENLLAARQIKNNRIDDYLLRGRRAAAKNQFVSARGWFKKAQALENSARVGQELNELKLIITQKADQLAKRAAVSMQNAHFKQARELFAQALSLVPGHQQALQGKHELDINLANSVEALLQKGRRALEQGSHAQAMQIYRSILELSPDNQRALNGMRSSREAQSLQLSSLVESGRNALATGNLAEAERYLAKALALDAYHETAQQLRQRLEQVQQTGAVKGDEQRLYLQGIAYYTQGKYPEAIKSWETVLLLDPDHEKSKQNISKTRLKMKQIEEYRGG